MKKRKNKCKNCRKSYVGFGIKFCSNKCANQHKETNELRLKNRRSYIGKNHPRWKGTKVIFCLNCKKRLEVSLCNNQKYCSCRCGKLGKSSWNKGLKGYNSREKNPNWKGGVSFINYGVGFTKLLKRKIFERDNFHCQLCGNNRNLNVHHIDYNKQNNNWHNLITLCHQHNMIVNKDKVYWENYFIFRINRICNLEPKILYSNPFYKCYEASGGLLVQDSINDSH